ncbi:hypothetical protein BC827DRAFT_1267178 [Russula dissimulans]|nr:hypothetical protein BC827DRAFT_1267178 [Russula dissimulans]
MSKKTDGDEKAKSTALRAQIVLALHSLKSAKPPAQATRRQTIFMQSGLRTGCLLVITGVQRPAEKLSESTCPTPTGTESSANDHSMLYSSFRIHPHQPEIAVASKDAFDAHPSQLHAHTTGVDFTDPAANHANSGPPPAHITGLPLPAIMGLMEQGNQSHGVGHLTTSQFVPLIPGQPEPGLEYHAPLGPPHETPDVGPLNGPPHHVPGPFHGNSGPVGMPLIADDLKHLANHYLDSPRSQVKKLQVQRERTTGRSKVLIVLEIDDTM